MEHCRLPDENSNPAESSAQASTSLTGKRRGALEASGGRNGELSRAAGKSGPQQKNRLLDLVDPEKIRSACRNTGGLLQRR